MKKIEQFLINNMTGVLFSFIGIIFLFWLTPLINLPTWGFISDLFGIQELRPVISTQYMLSSIGAIFAFWYGYKKYERDKELEIIEKYGNKYNKLKESKNYKNLIELWYEEIYLYSSGYITKELWNDWKYWIQEDIKKLLLEDMYNSLNLNDFRNAFEINCGQNKKGPGYMLSNKFNTRNLQKTIKKIKKNDKSFFNFYKTTGNSKKFINFKLNILEELKVGYIKNYDKIEKHFDIARKTYGDDFIKSWQLMFTDGMLNKVYQFYFEEIKKELYSDLQNLLLLPLNTENKGTQETLKK